MVPTLLADVEVSVPEFMQGHVREEIFLPDSSGRNLGQVAFSPVPQTDGGYISEAEEDELTFTRLREMGYL